MDEERQFFVKDKLFYVCFFFYGCSGVLVNWIMNEYEEILMEIVMQFFCLVKDMELYFYCFYVKEELEEQ